MSTQSIVVIGLIVLAIMFVIMVKLSSEKEPPKQNVRQNKFDAIRVPPMDVQTVDPRLIMLENECLDLKKELVDLNNHYIQKITILVNEKHNALEQSHTKYNTLIEAEKIINDLEQELETAKCSERNTFLETEKLIENAKQDEKIISDLRKELEIAKYSEHNALFEAEKIIENAQQKSERILKEAGAKAESMTKKLREKLTMSAFNEKIYKEKILAIPWLAEMYAKVKKDIVEVMAEAQLNKNRPSINANVAIKEMKQDFYKACKAQKEAEYLVLYYRSLAPDLEDIAEGENPPEAVGNIPEVDPAKIESDDQSWLSPEEYQKLSPRERAILSFERYKDKKKRRSKREIGRDYERFIGYEYETKGFNVIYQGIIKGFEDLGRDLICEKRNNKGQVKEAVIVQCKYWSSKKLIHEKHINQLFGTMVEFAARIHEKEKSFYSFWDTIQCYNIKSVLITSTQLSPEAKKFAEILNVGYEEKYEIGEYPMIKCNVNQTTQEKIYHLPYDQMYDYVIIEPKKGEFYAMTIDEAEEKGFRRAMRHHWQGN